MSTLHHALHHPDNGAGWQLGLHQTWDDVALVRTRRPLLIVPGYGMNSFIFSYHPTGASFERYFVERGFEVWRVDLRAQGDSRSTGGSDRFSMEDLVLTDLKIAIDTVLAKSATGSGTTRADRVDVIGASLGGTLTLAHAVLEAGHKLGSIVTMGAPVRWVHINPVLRAAFASPWLVGQVRLRGTRRLAERLLPQLVRFVPWVLSIYMNPDITDTSAASEMVRTVEDPNRFINRQIAQWVRDRDLYLQGVNVSEGLPTVTRPYLCVLANRDGIVPRETALYPYQAVGSEVRQLIEVGNRELRMAHADMFISDAAHAEVFAPIASWLAAQA